MPEDQQQQSYKKHRGKAVARVGLYPAQMAALAATRPDDKTLTQYVNDLLLEVLNAKR